MLPLITGILGAASAAKNLFSDPAGEAEHQKATEYARQKEFAQMGIRWKVEDAKAAGLHPLAAIGAAGASYSPQAVVLGEDRLGGAVQALNEMQRHGQNTNRAQAATMTEDERRLAGLTLRNAELRNQLLEAQIANLRQPTNPPMPTTTGAPRGLPEGVVLEPSKQVMSKPGSPHLEAAPTPALKRFNIGGGASVDLPSQAMSESVEAMGPFAGPLLVGISKLREAWHGHSRPKTAPPAGYDWAWSPWKQSWSLEKVSKPRAPYPTPAYNREFKPRQRGN